MTEYLNLEFLAGMVELLAGVATITAMLGLFKICHWLIKRSK